MQGISGSGKVLTVGTACLVEVAEGGMCATDPSEEEEEINPVG